MIQEGGPERERVIFWLRRLVAEATLFTLYSSLPTYASILFILLFILFAYVGTYRRHIFIVSPVQTTHQRLHSTNIYLLRTKYLFI